MAFDIGTPELGAGASNVAFTPNDGTAANPTTGAGYQLRGTNGDATGVTPHNSMYASYQTNVSRVGDAAPVTSTSGFDFQTGLGHTGADFDLGSQNLKDSLKLNVYDPWGSASRSRRYGAQTWINPYDPRNASMTATGSQGDVFKYNQMFMTMAQAFDPFMQKLEAEMPHWWLNRIPRGAFQLENGTVHETRIYRGGLSVYAGLSDWEDLAPDPTERDACAPLPFKTYDYAWETLAWSGKRTAWGSDPICIDILRFIPKAAEQLGWILETGVKFGTAIQNIWNRDKYIDTTVRAGRSFVMTSEYTGAHSRRYIYDPFCRFNNAAGTADPAVPKPADQTGGSAMVANTAYVDKPFIVIDAEGDIEPLNFDRLELERNQLKRRYPDAAVGRIGSELMFALCVSQDDVEKYIRGNEEERKYWIEANPQALIQHYGFAPTTFRRWVITDDQDQLRFKLKRMITSYTDTEAAHYGYVGYKELKDKKVYIAEYVPPEVKVRNGINGSAVPGPNPDYDTAELAIAVVFMNKVFTNLFVPDYNANIGHGTFFGPKTGVNGQWKWYNIQTPENPDNRIGNFKGVFEIVPKPDVHVFDSLSFLYRRCTQPLPSLCPAENARINPTASAETSTVSSVSTDPVVGSALTVYLTEGLIAPIGTQITMKKGTSGTAPTVVATVFESKSNTTKFAQVTSVSGTGTGTSDAVIAADLVGATVTVG
jgi:hypothetical protein